ncbi:MAG: hypothetical protein Q9181_004085, partial [Wetmoreana brouardii]
LTMTATQATTAAHLQCAFIPSLKHSKDVIEITGPACEPLTISFQRTIRVPDNGHVFNLPPSMWTFPLYSVAQYKEFLPADMALKCGLFLPMYRRCLPQQPKKLFLICSEREAMWVRFVSYDQFAIKSVQDYVVTPDQLWLDGIASTEGRVRQFVAMPIGSGYTVEAQVTGEDITGGLQFEVTPGRTLKSQPPIERLFVKTMTGKTLLLTHLSASTTVAQLKDRIHASEGIPADQQRLVYRGKNLQDDLSVRTYKIPNVRCFTPKALDIYY